MLKVGIVPQEVFGGDKLLSDLETVKSAYSGEEKAK